VVVASSTTPEEKLRGTEAEGAELVLHDPLEDRARLTSRLAHERGLAFISPYDDPVVIAGQGTATRELLRDAPNLDAVIVPVSGGGLLAGCALAAHHAGDGIRVFGVESAAVARMSVSLRTGRRESVTAQPTIADALRVTRPGAVTFPIISSLVETWSPSTTTNCSRRWSCFGTASAFVASRAARPGSRHYSPAASRPSSSASASS